MIDTFFFCIPENGRASVYFWRLVSRLETQFSQFFFLFTFLFVLQAKFFEPVWGKK